jgi:ankyrin repeat protein
VNLTTYIDKLSSLFMDIGRSAPRHEAIGLLYPQSKKLQSHLTEYFIVVVGLCHYLFNFAQKSIVQQLTSSLSDSHLKTFQVDLDRWANLINEQMHVNEAQKSSEFRTFTKTMFKSVTNQQRRATRMQVLEFCSRYDNERDWKQIRKAGNTSFHKQQEKYREWRNSPQSCTLLYTGKLGSGKSVLLANVVVDLSLNAGKEHLAYFFCRHDVPESLLARTIVGSLARQLLRTLPDLDVLAASCEDTHTTGSTDKVLEILFRGFSSDAKIYFILDGLDECDHKEKKTLVQAIRQIQRKAKLLVCASLREEANNSLQSVAKQFIATSVVSMPTENPDIEAFIEAELERCLLEERLTIGDPTLILEIQDALLKGSQGMFLWVALQIKSLCSVKTDHAIREALVDLPKTLSETFARILKKSGITDPELQAKTLQLVFAAHRPLTTEELREALSVTPGEAVWDASHLLNNVYSALGCCGCLLVVDEEEFTVRVVHHSVKQYILNGLDDIQLLKFSLPGAQRTMADIIVTYLGYGVFGTELLRAKVHPMMAQSTPSKIVQATIGSSNATSRLATRLLRSRRQPAFDMSKAIVEARDSFKSNPQHTFKFYTYAKAYWQEYLLHVSEQNAAMSKLCSKLVYSRASQLEKVDKEYWTLLQWAARNEDQSVIGLLLENIDMRLRDKNPPDLLQQAVQGRYNDALEVLLSTGKVDVNAKYEYGRTALISAAKGGDNDIVKILLTRGKADVDVKDNFGRTALMFASDGGYSDIVEVLLTVGKADVEAKDDEGCTALMFAAPVKDTLAVELLLRVSKANVEAKDDRGRTALILGVQWGNTKVVQLLLCVGAADVEAKDNKGCTALLHAVREGDARIVELLLRVGKADINAKDNSGQMALEWAESENRVGRDEDVIKVLRSYLEHDQSE